MKLHYHPISGHAHRVQNFLSILGLPHQLVLVDLTRGEHKAPPFLALNPFGQVPVLEDGGHVIPDSNAILVYLARRYAPEWLPAAPLAEAAVQRWLSVAAGDVAFGMAAARIVQLFGRADDMAPLVARAHRILALMEAQLTGREWIALDTPTIADISLYSYAARAPEGNVDLVPYPNVRAWLERIEALPGFAPFGRTPVGLAA
ncbi:glutathione S-transferase family protein [Pseudoduganella chitinolytica]|uniref:Glutathione S-transferase n=1 Tax=Pseudoduganella chitinolytica TaxID=34070 RepID=A0ABY8BF59_9BURK|nr:glutathione S-transferase [Pseudoduganella chitinolytica]WEF33933.1 glutathione S-transferase [Pseudoduganella chitinolytica]